MNRRALLRRIGLTGAALALPWNLNAAVARRLGYQRPPVATPRLAGSALGLVQSVAAPASASGTATTITTAAITTTPGNLLVAQVYCDTNKIGTTPITDSKGNTWIAAVPAFGSTTFCAMFYAANCLGGASHTFTFTPTGSDFIAIAVMEVTGAAASAVLGSTATSITNTPTHTAGPITANPTVPEIFIGGHNPASTATTPYNVISPLPEPWYWNWLATAATREGAVYGARVVAAGTTDSFRVTGGASGAYPIMIAGFKAAAPATGGGAVTNPIALVAHGKYSAGTSGGGTSAAIDTTGATLIVVVVGDENNYATITDSKGNTWTRQISSANNANEQSNIWYAKNPIVGTGHTFTAAGSTVFPTFCVAAFSGVNTDPAGVTTAASAHATGTTSASGSVTPPVPGCLVIAGLGHRDTSTPTIAGGFTIVDTNPFIAATAVGSALAYQIQTTRAAAVPSWAWTNSVQASSVVGYFQPIAPSGVACASGSMLPYVGE